jgi:hypothetical protein
VLRCLQGPRCQQCPSQQLVRSGEWQCTLPLVLPLVLPLPLPLPLPPPARRCFLACLEAAHHAACCAPSLPRLFPQVTNSSLTPSCLSLHPMQFGTFLEQAFPRAKVIRRNGAIPATSAAYTYMCLEMAADEDIDLLFIEFTMNDGFEEAIADNSRVKVMERLVRKAMGKPHAPAVALMQVSGRQRVLVVTAPCRLCMCLQVLGRVRRCGCRTAALVLSGTALAAALARYPHPPPSVRWYATTPALCTAAGAAGAATSHHTLPSI